MDNSLDPQMIAMAEQMAGGMPAPVPGAPPMGMLGIPPEGMLPGPPPMDPDGMLAALLSQLGQAWGQQEQSVDAQKQALIELMTQMLGDQAAQMHGGGPEAGFAEGGMPMPAPDEGAY